MQPLPTNDMPQLPPKQMKKICTTAVRKIKSICNVSVRCWTGHRCGCLVFCLSRLPYDGCYSTDSTCVLTVSTSHLTSPLSSSSSSRAPVRLHSICANSASAHPRGHCHCHSPVLLASATTYSPREGPICLLHPMLLRLTFDHMKVAAQVDQCHLAVVSAA